MQEDWVGEPVGPDVRPGRLGAPGRPAVLRRQRAGQRRGAAAGVRGGRPRHDGCRAAGVEAEHLCPLLVDEDAPGRNPRGHHRGRAKAAGCRCGSAGTCASHGCCWSSPAPAGSASTTGSTNSSCTPRTGTSPRCSRLFRPPRPAWRTSSSRLRSRQRKPARPARSGPGNVQGVPLPTVEQGAAMELMAAGAEVAERWRDDPAKVAALVLELAAGQESLQLNRATSHQSTKSDCRTRPQATAVYGRAVVVGGGVWLRCSRGRGRGLL